MALQEYQKYQTQISIKVRYIYFLFMTKRQIPYVNHILKKLKNQGCTVVGILIN